MFVAIFFLVLIGGTFGVAWWKSPGFRKFVKGIGGSGDNSVSPRDIQRAKDRLAKEKERTASLKEWADIQNSINAERAKQSASRAIIQGGKR